MAPSRLTYDTCLVLSFTMMFLISIVASSFHPKPVAKGFTQSLIPPTSPHSPFYTQVLKANNISAAAKNITLGLKVLSTYSSTTPSTKYQSKHSIITHHKVAGYVMDMFIGEPLQYVFGTFDTGSELIWFHCEGQMRRKLRSFRPSKSSMYKQILCGDDKRCDITHDDIDCDHYEKLCIFEASYEDDSLASGIMSTDEAMLYVTSQFMSELMFGCSTNNTPGVMGIIGAGMGQYSLPSQMYPNDSKFSYCISYDKSKRNLVKFGPEADLAGLSTEVYKHQQQPFYYMDVLSIQVNGVDIDVATYVYEMLPDGTRGFIIDSGTAITSLTPEAFEALKGSMVELLGKPTPYWIFEICYTPGRLAMRKLKRWPTILIRFGELDFMLPRTGTWEGMKNANLVCLLIERSDNLLSVLGYEQLYDVNVGHDVKNNRLYLSQTKCATTQDGDYATTSLAFVLL